MTDVQKPDDEPTDGSPTVHSRQPARRRGVASSMLAAGLFALDEVLGRKPKKDTVEIREASGEPGDIDKDGITVAVDDNTVVHSPAPRARTGRRTVEKRHRQGN